MQRKILVWFTVALIVGLVVTVGSACCQAAKLHVAASILPLADFCRQIGGDKVEVQELIPPGASPHTFEPSPSVLEALAKAQVLVYVGAGLEPWLDKYIQARSDKKTVLVEATHGLDLISEVGGHTEEPEAHHSHHHEGGNPHVWLDPVLAENICRRIAAAFEQADQANRAFYEKNLAHYLEQLGKLNQEIAKTTAAFRLRQFVGFHPSFSYFARRYHLEQVGIIEVAPGREPTPKALQNIIGAIKRYGIKVIFSEPQFSPRIAEVLAKEAGVRILPLDPIGGHPPYGNDYVKMMQYNVATMAKAMQ